MIVLNAMLFKIVLPLNNFTNFVSFLVLGTEPNIEVNSACFIDLYET